MNSDAYDILHGSKVDEKLLPWDPLRTEQPVRTCDLYLELRIDRLGELAHRNPYVLAQLEPDRDVLEICEIVSILARGQKWPRAEFPRIIPLLVRLAIINNKKLYCPRGYVERYRYGEVADDAYTALLTYRDDVVIKYEQKGDAK